MAAAHSQAPSAQSKRHSVYERYLFKVCWLFSLKTYELGLAVSPNFNFDLSPGRLQRFSLPNAGRNHSPCAVPTTLDDSASDLLTWRPDFFQPLALKEGINDASMEMWLPKLELCLTFLLSCGEFSLVFRNSYTQPLFRASLSLLFVLFPQSHPLFADGFILPCRIVSNFPETSLTFVLSSTSIQLALSLLLFFLFGRFFPT